MFKLPEKPESIFSQMSNLAAQHQAINLSQGFPDFEGDPYLTELVIKAMQDGYNQYAPMAGDLGFRERISAMVDRLYGAQYDPNAEITISNGATQALFCAMASVLEKGDEVIVFSPAYDSYKPVVELFGAKVVAIPLKPPHFRPDWGAVTNLLTTKTKMIIINNPHNPCGTVLSLEDMQALERIVVEHKLWLLSDEVYAHMVFDEVPFYSASSLPELAKRSFVAASFGKTFHNTGWKMGYCVAPKLLMDEYRKVHEFNAYCVNHPMQKAMATYLEEPETYLGLPALFQAKRDRFLKGLQGTGFTATPTQGTYFQVLDYTAITDENDIDLAIRLTKELGVASIPMSRLDLFGRQLGYLRFCFAKKDETLGKAVAILNAL
ncbi:methionine aminotransferase [Sediminicola luteus]|uniref:Methionine aminotransferase n=1 Tax=Sediminicola luteus TaxID=319238 RepID=A0A2A4G6D9_9FLAO|nr:methionine aminotransferase [Sediminicola luteus]PCE63524.1 methionine aminotransferase [Sediminicola luteus]